MAPCFSVKRNIQRATENQQCFRVKLLFLTTKQTADQVQSVVGIAVAKRAARWQIWGQDLVHYKQKVAPYSKTTPGTVFDLLSTVRRSHA